MLISIRPTLMWLAPHAGLHLRLLGPISHPMVTTDVPIARELEWIGLNLPLTNSIGTFLTKPTAFQSLRSPQLVYPIASQGCSRMIPGIRLQAMIKPYALWWTQSSQLIL